MAELPEHEARSIRQYVESQLREDDNPVDLVQKVGSRRVSGRSHDLYDVWMKDGERWWVITNLTNLYAQKDFNSIDQAFTYHLGVCLILSERSRTMVTADDDEPVSPAWRTFTRAADAMNDASEAEDFQAVGVRCREALLALVRDHLDDDWAPSPEPRPKLADFKTWMGALAAVLASGRPRSYLKALADRNWDLTVWLQHNRDATEWDAELVLDATAHLLNTFEVTLVRNERGQPRRCPACDSYRVVEDGHLATENGRQGWLAQDVCSACGGRGEQTFDAWSD